jgi:hypothetical protein
MNLETSIDVTHMVDQFEEIAVDAFNWTNPVKVTVNFDPDRVIGQATLCKEGDKIIATIEIDPGTDFHIFTDDFGRYSIGER